MEVAVLPGLLGRELAASGLAESGLVLTRLGNVYS